ncbi:helix-turn-helix transcriptional regulator [Streptomyces sp. NBC_00828]|uniref:helix-turn-helix domain-containing protein n=1 Tax=Streptomyces sp. NBC_00828 TaxID=2903678 RepID=UPI003863FF9E
MQDLPDDDTWNADRRRAIGENIRKERCRQGLTQDDVWMAAHLTRWTIQRVESGADVKLSTLLRIARALDVPLADLVR